MGYKSEIIGITLKNDVQKIRGKAGSLIIFEEAGKFPNLLAAWQIARPSVEQGSHVFGTMIAFGTGGTADADFEGLKELFYRPSAYNCLQLENIWDEDALGQKCGLFIPQYANLEGEYFNKDNPDDPYNGRPFMDEDGNTIEEVAKRFILLQRQKVVENSTDKRAIDRHVSEQPVLPSEAVLNLSTNIFPKSELQKHLATIRNDVKYRNFKHVGNLRQKEDMSVVFEHSPKNKQKDITRYRLDPKDDPTGQIVIWEHPIDNAPWGLYIAGCLTPGEKVNTKEGLKNVEDITLDDRLISKDGDFVNINTLLRYEKENEPVHKVHMSNVLKPTVYTQEHPLYVSEHAEGSYNFVRMRNVKNGMWTKFPNYYRKNSKDLDTSIWDKYKSNKVSTNPLHDEDFWWFVGHWLGDGFNNKQGYNYTIYNSFGINEAEYVDKYKSIVSRLFSRNACLKKQNGSNTHKFEHKQLFLFLEDNFGKYADGKYISEWVKYIPDVYKKYLILGYLDSDGSVYKDRNKLRGSFTSINKTLLDDIQDILFSLGLVSNLCFGSPSKKYCINDKEGCAKQSFKLYLNSNNLVEFYKMFNSDCGSRKLRNIKKEELPGGNLNSKGCKFDEDKDYIYVQISNIEEYKYTGIVYNFDCETHTFISRYCATHNCDPLKSAA